MVLSEEPDKFGIDPSQSAVRALERFKRQNVRDVLEIGCGQGRDALHFARNSIHVSALDYSENGIKTVLTKADELGLSKCITARAVDARSPLPFSNCEFDACYSHMLFSSALTMAELKELITEIERVLRSGGLHFFTARNTNDPYYQTGIHRGENLYEVDGYIMHFMSRENIMHLVEGFEILEINEIEEGRLPKKLFEVITRKTQ